MSQSIAAGTAGDVARPYLQVTGKATPSEARSLQAADSRSAAQAALVERIKPLLAQANLTLKRGQEESETFYRCAGEAFALLKPTVKQTKGQTWDTFVLRNFDVTSRWANKLIELADGRKTFPQILGVDPEKLSTAKSGKELSESPPKSSGKKVESVAIALSKLNEPERFAALAQAGVTSAWLAEQEDRHQPTAFAVWPNRAHRSCATRRISGKQDQE